MNFPQPFRIPKPAPLVGKVVVLEPLTPEHIPALTEAGADPELWRVTVSNAGTPERMRDYVAEAIAQRAAGTALPFAVRLRETGALVGCTRLGSIDRANRVAEVGWTWYRREHQGTRVNPEAKLLLLSLAFDDMGCFRVEFKTDAVNARSRAAILKLGAVEEGTLRSKVIVQGGRRRDTVFFSILDREWPAVRETLERRLARPETGPEPRP